MILEKLRNQSGFTGSEKSIADYILSHAEEVQQFTAEELARETLTSKSSVIRLCKKLGTTGYQELKKLIFAENALANKALDPALLFALDNKSKYSDYMKTLDFLYESVISKMHEQLDHNVIKRVTNQLNQMDRIDFYSSGLGYAIGEATAHKFGTIGIESSAFTSINEAFWVTNKNNVKVAAIVISLSGRNPSIINIAKSLKRYGIYVVGIAGAASKEMKQHCDEVVLMVEGNIPAGIEHSAIGISTNYIFDLIYMGLLVKRYDKQKDLYLKMKRNFEGVTDAEIT